MLSIDAWLDEKPYREVYDGAIHEKVSPRRQHNLVALRISLLLAAWGTSAGETLPEQRVHLAPGVTLVPDVAFISDKRLARLSKRERETPPFAPDIAVEVRSPADRPTRIARKTALYLEHGSTLVLDVDPDHRTIGVHTSAGHTTLRSGDVLEHPACSQLRIAVDDVFAPLDRMPSC